jgi:outer membrane putative beta-barrel porin/alpha-amylase
MGKAPDDRTKREMRHFVMGTVLVLLGAGPALAQDEPRVKFSTSVNYSIGDYGTGKDTTIVYVPFTLGVRPFDRFWLSLTVPFIYQDTQNVVLTGGGVASRKNQKGKAAQPATSTTESGLGDVLLKASVVVVEERDLIPEITPYLKIKFPTADADRGLGTGEYDETLGVDIDKRLIGALFGYLTLAYTFIGDPPGTDFRNSFGWSVGAAYAVVQPLSLFAFIEGSTSISRGQADPVELRGGAEFRATKWLRLTGAVTRGLTSGAADWGISAALSLRF